VTSFGVRFPPPVRITAPLVALVFGLAATFFHYRLNLALDLDRYLDEVRARQESSGERLARASERLLASGELNLLRGEVEAMPDLPQEEFVAVVDHDGRIIADSTGANRGKPLAATPFAPASVLMRSDEPAQPQHTEDERAVLSAFPFRLPDSRTGWALLLFDRSEAIAAVQSDARTQLAWMSAAMALLSFVLWAVLHFGFTERIGRLARSVEAFGRGEVEAPETLRGGDEVAALSAAFTDMATNLRDREIEQLRLEREVLDSSENERRRIGHEVHDSLGQKLTAAALSTNALAAALGAQAPALVRRAEDIGQQLRDAIAEARTLSHGLAPVELIDDGLMAALARLADDTARSSETRCVFECEPPVRIADGQTAGELYRIAQEAVANALKHAGASEIRIGLERCDGSVFLDIEDDGEGFDETAPPGDGIGLRVMQYRARLIGAALEVGAAPAGGTRVHASVKLPS
jgi:signal transduction histidine kinase